MEQSVGSQFATTDSAKDAGRSVRVTFSSFSRLQQPCFGRISTRTPFKEFISIVSQRETLCVRSIDCSHVIQCHDPAMANLGAPCIKVQNSGEVTIYTLIRSLYSIIVHYAAEHAITIVVWWVKAKVIRDLRETGMFVQLRSSPDEPNRAG